MLPRHRQDGFRVVPPLWLGTAPYAAFSALAPAVLGSIRAVSYLAWQALTLGVYAGNRILKPNVSETEVDAAGTAMQGIS